MNFDTYKPEYAAAFKALNIHWLEQFFTVEQHDQNVLGNPVKLEDNVVGVVALMPDENGVFELTKMAVDSNYRGQKIGQQLLQFTIDFAKKKGLDSLILYSSKKLENAIYLYHKFGFKEIPLEQPNPYLRADIKMQIKL